MPHVYIHEGCAGKEIFRLGGYNCDFVITQFADKSGSSDSRNSISNDSYTHNFFGFDNEFNEKGKGIVSSSVVFVRTGTGGNENGPIFIEPFIN